MTVLEKVFYTVALPVFLVLEVKKGVWSGLKQSYQNVKVELKTYKSVMRS